MTEAISVSAVIPASPEQLYHAWLDSKMHSEMTAGAASIELIVGGALSAWDGYIRGRTLELEPLRRILQAWRTSEFPSQSPDSLLEILFERVEEGTRVTLNHSQIPEGQGEGYEQGWRDYYFTPMQAYFAK